MKKLLLALLITSTTTFIACDKDDDNNGTSSYYVGTFEITEGPLADKAQKGVNSYLVINSNATSMNFYFIYPDGIMTSDPCMMEMMLSITAASENELVVIDPDGETATIPISQTSAGFILIDPDGEANVLEEVTPMNFDIYPPCFK